MCPVRALAGLELRLGLAAGAGAVISLAAVMEAWEVVVVVAQLPEKAFLVAAMGRLTLLVEVAAVAGKPTDQQAQVLVY